MKRLNKLVMYLAFVAMLVTMLVGCAITTTF